MQKVVSRPSAEAHRQLHLVPRVEDLILDGIDGELDDDPVLALTAEEEAPTGAQKHRPHEARPGGSSFDAHRYPSSGRISRFPNSSTSARYPGCINVVESSSCTTAGPQMRAPAPRPERSYTGHSAKPPASSK